MGYIAWLNLPLAREDAGGKGASLSDLLAAGFPVPDGFCVLAEGYRHFINAAGLQAPISELLNNVDVGMPGSAQDVAKQISHLVAHAPMPEDLVRELSAAYEALGSTSDAACAVRSSAVSEDGSAAAFAGLYESYLNVRGSDNVRAAMQKCYASLWTQRAIEYRRRQGHAWDEAMAVVVMSLVSSDVSGVAFTAHPVTGSTDVIVINSSFGLGEAVVSGAVSPDSYVFEKSSFTLLERDISPKEIAIYAHPDQEGTVELSLDALASEQPSLSDAQARAVARLAARVEAHCRQPQDVEWALKDDQLILLQSRPITTLHS